MSAATADRPWLTVGVPTRDRPDQLAGLLDAVADSAASLGERWRVEVLVADGGRDPAPIPDVLHADVDAVRRVRVHGGVSTGRNALCAEARGDVLLLVDDDVRPRPGALAALAAAVVPGTVVAGRVTGVGHRPGEPSQLMAVGRSGYGEPAGDGEADYAVSALLGVPRDVYTSVSWDERFAVAHLDDVAYGLRLREAGVRLALCEDARADHPPRRAADKDRPELAGHRAVVVLRRYRGRAAAGPWLRCLGHLAWTHRHSARALGTAVAGYTGASLRERTAR
jgi:GT2 family glycosyltransferase